MGDHLEVRRQVGRQPHHLDVWRSNRQLHWILLIGVVWNMMADHEGNIVLTESSVDLVDLVEIHLPSKVMARQQKRKGHTVGTNGGRLRNPLLIGFGG